MTDNNERYKVMLRHDIGNHGVVMGLDKETGEAFPSDSCAGSLHNNDIGEWHCVEYDPYDYIFFWTALSASRAYANRILSLIDAVEEENNND